jgi:hypothetical protein
LSNHGYAGNGDDLPFNESARQALGADESCRQLPAYFDFCINLWRSAGHKPIWQDHSEQSRTAPSDDAESRHFEQRGINGIAEPFFPC